MSHETTNFHEIHKTISYDLQNLSNQWYWWHVMPLMWPKEIYYLNTRKWYDIVYWNDQDIMIFAKKKWQVDIKILRHGIVGTTTKYIVDILLPLGRARGSKKILGTHAIQINQNDTSFINGRHSAFLVKTWESTKRYGRSCWEQVS
jgi:hypothetical protein